MTEENKRLGNWLKMHRARIGITQAELADRVEVSRKTINSVENGVFIPSTVLALKLARALDVPVDCLFYLTDRGDPNGVGNFIGGGLQR